MAEKSYFDQVPVWGNESGYNFRVMADQVSGRIPVTRLERWQDLAEVLESEFFNRSDVQHIFRGHRRFDWSLAPTLARINSDTNIILQVAAEKQLEQFRLAVRGRLIDRTLVDAGEDDELWAVGQHHGLMTPLLDWTHSPYVALFFAFAGEDVTSESDNEYRAIYVLNKSFVGDNELCPDIRLLQPRKDDHGRLVNQAGLFTFSPYGETIENAITDILADDDFPDDDLKNAEMKIEEEKAEGVEEEQSEAQGDAESEVLARYICKIYIKNEERDGCLRHLRRMNVHHASLFPDLIGASEYCNMLMADVGADSAPSLKDASEIFEEIFGGGFKISDAEKISPDTHATPDRDTIMKIVSAFVKPPAMLPGDMIEMSRAIAAEIQRNTVVDWDKRDAAKARIRNGVRVVLRKEGCPPEYRDQIADGVMELLSGAVDSVNNEE